MGRILRLIFPHRRIRHLHTAVPAIRQYRNEVRVNVLRKHIRFQGIHNLPQRQLVLHAHDQPRLVLTQTRRKLHFFPHDLYQPGRRDSGAAQQGCGQVFSGEIFSHRPCPLCECKRFFFFALYRLFLWDLDRYCRGIS